MAKKWQVIGLRGLPGETGPQGPPGADGKTAYQYAQDGGYTGTEEDFSKKLASEDSGQNVNGLSDTAKTLLITILRNGVYSADQSANITALEAALASSGNSGDDSGGSGDDNEEPEQPVVPDEPSAGESLLYSWDFTKSLTDTVSGNVATLNGSSTATQDSNGVTLNTPANTDTSYVGFTTNIFGANRRYEVDIVSVTNVGAASHFARLFMLNGTKYKTCGLLYNPTKGGWDLYNAKGWTHEVSAVATTLDYLNGKTLKVQINSDYTWDVYADDELIVESTSPMNCLANDTDFSQCNIILGTNVGSSDALGAVITGLRVYNVGVAE